jgi:hypothetical protein
MVRDKRSAVMKASFVVAVSLALGLVAAVAPIASAQTDPHVGTWKLNPAKSKFTPGPAPKSQTFTYEADGPNLTVLVQGVDAEGKPINPDKNKVTIITDGKDHPATNTAYDSAAWKKTSTGYDATRKKAGKVVQTVTNVVSKDGKTMTITTKGTNAKGETFHDVAVYDKQ